MKKQLLLFTLCLFTLSMFGQEFSFRLHSFTHSNSEQESIFDDDAVIGINRVKNRNYSLDLSYSIPTKKEFSIISRLIMARNKYNTTYITPEYRGDSKQTRNDERILKSYGLSIGISKIIFEKKRFRSNFAIELPFQFETTDRALLEREDRLNTGGYIYAYEDDISYVRDRMIGLNANLNLVYFFTQNFGIGIETTLGIAASFGKGDITQKRTYTHPQVQESSIVTATKQNAIVRTTLFGLGLYWKLGKEEE